MSVEAIRASTSSDIDSAFGSFAQKGIEALFVTNDPCSSTVAYKW
jgi:hypothetical protein